MRWSRPFIALMLGFVDRVIAVGGITRGDALLGWTPLYLNFGLSRSFDPSDAPWQEFIAGYRDAVDPVEWAHSFYLAHARDYPDSPYGCFSYHYEPESRCVRFHFGNRDTSSQGPLREERRQERLQELTAMFTDVRREVPEAEYVRGRSWMYNLESYRRLFPPEYVCTATRVQAELQFMSLWGQFLERNWELRSGPAGAFLHRIAWASTLDELAQSFPLPVLAPRCSVDHFYSFYGIS